MICDATKFRILFFTSVCATAFVNSLICFRPHCMENENCVRITTGTKNYSFSLFCMKSFIGSLRSSLMFQLCLVEPGSYERHKHTDKINKKTKHDISGLAKIKQEFFFVSSFVRFLAYAYTHYSRSKVGFSVAFRWSNCMP